MSFAEMAKMSASDMAQTDVEVNRINKQFKNKNAGEKSQMGKDTFLKLLVTELRHQDPTQPMADREFISQMAQFSSLEQMTNINTEFKSLLKSAESTNANSYLGKYIDAMNPATQKRVSGIVSSIRYADDQIRLLVGKEEVSIKDIHAVHIVNEIKK